MMYIPNLIKIGSGIQKLIRGGVHIPRYKQTAGDLTSLLLFLQNNERRLEISDL
jgi:hypothetical protein